MRAPIRLRSSCSPRRQMMSLPSRSTYHRQHWTILRRDLPMLAGRTRNRQRIGPRGYRWPKHRRSLNTGALANWRLVEHTLIGLPQFRTQIDGLGIHFIHVRSKHENALPIILTHGWPGSIIEFMQVVGPLVDPTAHGGKADEAFHVVIPSLPGFGSSDKPTETGWRLPRIANAWAVLMVRLGYSHYVAQGGDFGAGVSSWMAKQQPAGLVAIHLNLPIVFPPPPPPPSGYTAAEQPALAQLGKHASDGSGYASIQATRPQTLGYGLADSPVGQAMWIYEKFQHGATTKVMLRRPSLSITCW